MTDDLVTAIATGRKKDGGGEDRRLYRFVVVSLCHFSQMEEWKGTDG